MIVYTEDQVNSMATWLNSLNIKGIENAKRVALIAQMLDSGKRREEKEEDKEEEEDV